MKLSTLLLYVPFIGFVFGAISILTGTMPEKHYWPTAIYHGIINGIGFILLIQR